MYTGRMMSDLEATVDRNIAIHGRCENTVVRSVEDQFGEQCNRPASLLYEEAMESIAFLQQFTDDPRFLEGAKKLKKICQECWDFINGD